MLHTRLGTSPHSTLLLIATACVLCVVLVDAQPLTAGSLYQGGYFCNQGFTNLDVIVSSVELENVSWSGLFGFRVAAEECSGTYTITISLVAGDVFSMAPGEWLANPCGYIFIPAFNFQLSGGVMYTSGTAPQMGCTTLLLGLTTKKRFCQAINDGGYARLVCITRTTTPSNQQPSSSLGEFSRTQTATLTVSSPAHAHPISRARSRTTSDVSRVRYSSTLASTTQSSSCHVMSPTLTLKSSPTLLRTTITYSQRIASSGASPAYPFSLVLKAAAVGTLTALGGVRMGSAAAAVSFAQRTHALLLHAKTCHVATGVNTDDDALFSSPIDNPLALEITVGAADQRKTSHPFAVGTIVGNSVLAVTFALGVHIADAALQHLQRRLQRSETPATALEKISAIVHSALVTLLNALPLFPSSCVVPCAFLVQPFVTAAVFLVGHPLSSTPEVAVGAIALFFASALVVAVCWMALQVTHRSDSLRTPLVPWTDVASLLHWLFESEEIWLNCCARRRYGGFFGSTCVHRRWFPVALLGASLATAVVIGLAAAKELWTSCAAAFAVGCCFAAQSIAIIGIILYMKPFVCKVDALTLLLTGVLTAASETIILVVMLNASTEDSFLDAANTINDFIIYSQLISILACIAYSVLNDDRRRARQADASFTQNVMVQEEEKSVRFSAMVDRRFLFDDVDLSETFVTSNPNVQSRDGFETPTGVRVLVQLACTMQKSALTTSKKTGLQNLIV